MNQEIVRLMESQPEFEKSRKSEGMTAFYFVYYGEYYMIDYINRDKDYRWRNAKGDNPPQWFREIYSKVKILHLKKKRVKSILETNEQEEDFEFQLLESIFFKHHNGLNVAKQVKKGFGTPKWYRKYLEEYQNHMKELGVEIEIIEEFGNLYMKEVAK